MPTANESRIAAMENQNSQRMKNRRGNLVVGCLEQRSPACIRLTLASYLVLSLIRILLGGR
jgi:hypothetical protein